MIKQISEVIQLANARPETPVKRTIDDITIHIVNELFKRFSSIYGFVDPIFKETKQLDAHKREWMLAFMESKINSLGMLDQGLKKCRESESKFIPAIGKFIAWCEESFEIPTLDRAYDEACKNSYPGCDKSWSHKLVQHAWKLSGSNFLSNSARSVSYPVFKRNYDIAFREWRAGKPIAEIEIPKALTLQPDPVKSKEVSRKAIQDCLAKLRGTA
jgi:hypothetical protein